MKWHETWKCFVENEIKVNGSKSDAIAAIKTKLAPMKSEKLGRLMQVASDVNERMGSPLDDMELKDVIAKVTGPLAENEKKSEKQKEYEKQIKMEEKLEKMKEEIKKFELELLNQKYIVMRAKD